MGDDIPIERLKEKLLEKLYDSSFIYSPVPKFKLANKSELSRYYIDSKNTTLSPDGLRLVGQLFYHYLSELEVEAIGGLSFGADPISIAAATVANLEGKAIKAFSVRKQPKDYGTQKWIEGTVVRGEKVLIVDDVVTTGGSTLAAIQRSRDEGLEVLKVIVLVDRKERDDTTGMLRIDHVKQESGIEDVKSVFTIDQLMRIHNERGNDKTDSKRHLSGESREVNYPV